MASPSLKHLFLALASLSAMQLALSSDPDIISDFILPSNLTASNLDGNFFTFTGFRSLITSPTPAAFKATKATMAEFPALNGQSVSYAVLMFPESTPNPPHTHPRSAELLFVLGGSLQVGFVDTTNKLFTQTLQSGDVFVFPKGLLHFQYNPDAQTPALAISAFGSASAGTVSVPGAVFTTEIDDTVLAKSFKTDVATIQALKAGLIFRLSYS